MTGSRRLAPWAAAAALALGLAGCGSSSHPSATPSSATSPSSPVSPSPRPAGNLDPLTGKTSPQHGPLVAVMVENSEYGRPQYGLSSADVVYEAYTEFFYYSRYMLLFWGHAPAVVAPVRSARPYFVSFVHEWPGAAYAHAGASNPAYPMIAQDHIHNLDLDSNAYNLGWRSSTRPAPHNLFSNVQTLMAAARAQWGNPKIAPHWPFLTNPTAGTPSVTSVTLTWNPRNTVEQWRWDAPAQGWTRWVKCPECAQNQFTQVMGLNSGNPVVASNVILEYTHETYLPDPAHTGWIQISTHGSGNALMLLGHRVIHGTWQNAGSGQPTRFFMPNGQPARFNPGQTWIEVVPAPGSAANPFQLTVQ
ncbi:MAG: DUF3048 domain-containing protein [Thermaerobacter sp.]|nr:DUF3048 domain-containing protein [Thermaerobacter sp.]